MFIKNKYTTWYYKLIDAAKKRNVSSECLYEKHHIIPRSLGGDNSESNLVKLTIREHYIAHLLLTKMVSKKQHLVKMSWALHRMTFSKNTSRAYETNRKKWSTFLTETFHPERNQDEDYRHRLSVAVQKSWESDDQRKTILSKRMKDFHDKQKSEDLESYMKKQKERSKAGNIKAKEKLSKKIVFEGKDFLGWGELEQQTGISKHLYKKYYEKGIDPSFRIGKDGPMEPEDVKNVILQYCYQIRKSYPLTKEDAKTVCERAFSFGLITSRQADFFIQSFSEKERFR